MYIDLYDWELGVVVEKGEREKRENDWERVEGIVSEFGKSKNFRKIFLPVPVLSFVDFKGVKGMTSNKGIQGYR